MRIKQLSYTIKLKLLKLCIFFLLGISNLLIKTVKFKRLMGWLSNSSSEASSEPELSSKTISRLRLLSRSIETVSPLTPWRSMCFEQAITTSIILHWMKVSHTICFGVCKGINGELKAHAWTRASNCYITGYRNMHEFHMVYSSEYRR